MTEHHTEHHARAKKDMSAFYIPGAIIIAGLIIAGAVVFSHPITQAPSGQAGQQQMAVDIKKVSNLDTLPYIGEKNAPVTIAYWSDYQCPFCKQFEVNVLPTIISKYVETGKVRVVFEDFQFLGPDSMADAEYARAIWDLYPTRFYAWRTAFFDNHPQENSLTEEENIAHLNKVTASVDGIDLDKVKSLVKANKEAYDKAITAAMQEGSAQGINGTPAFIIGKTFINGAESVTTFTDAIDKAIK